MDNNEELMEKADLHKIATKGQEIYDEIKSKYEPQSNGKYLAIEVDSRNVYLADSSVEAVQVAKKEHPDKIFYIVRIGFDYVETLANYFIAQKL